MIALTVVAIAGCAGPAVSLPPLSDQELRGPRKDVWVVRHGWHTRIAVRRIDIDASIWPESRDFGDSTYIDVGWGDRGFYPKRRPSVWDAIDPVIRATPAVIHVGAFAAPPPERFRGQPVVRVSVSTAGLDRLARFVSDHVERDAAGRAVRIAPGYYERSAFYLARGRYHALGYNSNNWAATALQAAGLSIDPATTATAGALMRRVAAIAASQSDGVSDIRR